MSGNRPTPACFPLGPLAGEFYNAGRAFVLLRAFAFQDAGVVIVVPALSTSDFNSTPRVLWSVFSPWEYPEAGIVHDYLYRTTGHAYTRATADATHRRIMELTGARWWLRQTAYRALRLFGGRAWQGADTRGP